MNAMTRLGRARFPVLLVAVAAAGVLTAILARSSPPMMEDRGDPGSSFTGHHAAFQVGSIFRDPEDTQDLVNRADAIVVGAVGPVSHELMEAGYDDPPGTSEDPRGLPPPVLPFTYYHIVADEVLLDDGFVESTPS